MLRLPHTVMNISLRKRKHCSRYVHFEYVARFLCCHKFVVTSEIDVEFGKVFGLQGLKLKFCSRTLTF